MEEFATRTSNAFHMISLSTYFYPVFCFCFINFVLLLYMFSCISTFQHFINSVFV